jgi:hypothetical protein
MDQLSAKIPWLVGLLIFHAVLLAAGYVHQIAHEIVWVSVASAVLLTQRRTDQGWLSAGLQSIGLALLATAFSWAVGLAIVSMGWFGGSYDRIEAVAFTALTVGGPELGFGVLALWLGTFLDDQ